MILELLNKRTSVRKFSEQKIPNDLILEMLEAGRLSPSGGNEQSWKFGVVTDVELIKEITKASYNQKWLLSAPLLIVMCTVIVEDERGGRDIQIKRYPKYAKDIEDTEQGLYAALTLEEHQTKIPGTHMVLTALEKGVYSTWVSYFDVEAVSKLLGLPDDIMASEIIAFGYPEKLPKTIEKKPLEILVFNNHYNKTF